MRRTNVLANLLSSWQDFFWRKNEGGGAGRRVVSRRPEGLDPLEARVLLAGSLMNSTYVTFAVDVMQAGTYSVDVYKSQQQFSSNSVTNLAVNAVVPGVPVVVHAVASPIVSPGEIEAATWTTNLSAGRNLVRVNTAYFWATLPATGAQPVAPNGLTLTVDNSAGIKLAWADNSSNETGFLIERRVGSGNWTVFTTVAAGATGYTDVSVTTGSQYSYAVAAVNGTNSSATTNVTTAVVPSTVTAPAAPSNLALTVQSASSMGLTWSDNSNNETGFVIERQAWGSGSWVTLTTVGAGVTSYADRTVAESTQYSYRVSATNNLGKSSASNVATATTPATIPGAPSNLALSVQSASRINLTWSDNSFNETGFVIARQVGGSGTWVTLTTVGAGVTSYADSALAESTQYSYRVSASNSAGTSSASNVATATTPATIPAVPSGLALTVQSASRINLAWSDNSFNETGFVIARQVGGSGTWVTLTTVGAGVTNYADSALAESTQYSYRVSASNSAGTSSASNVVTATTPATIPGAPSNLALSVQSASRISLTWSDNSFNETGFVIARQVGGSGTWVTLTTVGAGVTNYADSALAESTQYSYRVSATDSAGTSSASNVATAATPATIPAVPSGLALTVQSASRINLAWSDNSFNETGFVIARQVGGSGTWVTLTTVGAGVTSYADSALAESTQYSYRVSATDSAGTSSASNVATATTPATIPAVPSNLALTVASASRINLVWGDNSFNETGFVIARQVGGSGTWVTLTTVGAGVTSYADSALAESTQYSYRVSASNSAGTSSASNVATATTPATIPAVPSGLALTVASPGQINLAWTDNSFNETGFVVERQVGGGSGSWTVLTTTLAGVANFADSGLAESTQYAYRVSASNSAGRSSVSNVATAATPATIPASPSGLAVTTVSTTNLWLNWTDNAFNETGFKIERQAGGASGSWSVVGTVAQGVTVYLDSGLLPGQSYVYRVSATNSAGSSTPSTVASGTTAGAANAASNLAALVLTSSQVQLTWADNSMDETGFKVERSTDGIHFSVVATTSANATTYTDANLADSTLYYYTIVTASSAGDATPSNWATVTTAATVMPGTLTGTNWAATAQPAAVGDYAAAGYTQSENAIARWDVVPYQTFDGEFNVGVVAFHSSGIDHVAFSVNGGAWTNVTQMTANPQTANTSGVGVDYDASGKGTYQNGVVEYWATLNAAQFATDGQVEVRAIAYPEVGTPRVLDSLYLSTNAHGTLPSLVRYVSPMGSDTTGDGTDSNPFATIARAADAFLRGSPVDGMYIYLAAGTYKITSTVYPHPITSMGWLTVTTAPGVDRVDVIIDGKDKEGYGIYTNLVHYKNLTFAPSSGANLSRIFNGKAGTTSIWIDSCNLVGPGMLEPYDWMANDLAGIYVTDVSITNCMAGVTLSRSDMVQPVLIRNVKVFNTGGGGGQICKNALVVNYSVTDTQSAGSEDVINGGFHAHGIQFYAGVGSVMGTTIIYGMYVRASSLVGGGMGWLTASKVAITDLAVVGCDMDNLVDAPSGGAAVFAMAGPSTNVYILDCTFTGEAYWRVDLGFFATDVVVESSDFATLSNNRPYGVVTGVTYR